MDTAMVMATDMVIMARNQSKRRKGKHRRQKKLWRKRILIGILLCLAAGAAASAFIWSEQKEQNSLQVTAGNDHDVCSDYRNILYKGEKYQYNNRVTTILYAGVDSTGKMESSVQYSDKARADTIALVVMDETNQKMTILSINRDTMTKVRRYTLNGNDNGLYTTHIGFAYSYGDGGKVSCENLCEAVSLLLSNVPIKRYVVTNPELTAGAEVTLTDENVKPFLQNRDTSESFSNEGRMERQKAYVTAYINKLKSMSTKELEKTWDSLDEMNDYLQTSITKNQYLELIKTMRKMDFTEDNFVILQGTDQEGELHDEFYADQEALLDLIVDLFYKNYNNGQPNFGFHLTFFYFFSN